MPFMFLMVSGVHKDVINEYYHKLVQVATEHPVHQIYEGYRCIRQTKDITRHKEHVVPISSPKSSLRHILRLDL